MARVSDEKIDEILSAVNIVHYLGQYVNLKKTGKNYKGLCPFHTEKTPSFIVNPEKQFYRCFGCGKGGNLFTFIMEYEKFNFPEALEKAADFAGIAMPRHSSSGDAESSITNDLYKINEITCEFFQKNLNRNKNKAYLEYFLKRNISERIIKSFRLGYCEDSYESLLNHFKKSNVDLEMAEKLGLIQKSQSGSGFYDKFRHRVIFPFFNTSGKIIGFGGRKLKDEQQPKYLNSPESIIYKKGQTLYGLHQAITAIRENEFAFLVEGYFDLLRLVEAGFRNVVASSGTALTDQQARLLRRYTDNIYITYDGDKAGIKAALSNARIIENQDVNAFIVPMPAGDDPDSFILKKGAKEFEKLAKERVLPVEFRLNQFFEKNPDPSLEAKDIFVRDVLEELVDFKSNIKTGLYLHHIADRLNISENMLVNELNRLKYSRNRWKKQGKTENEEKTERKLIKKGAYRAEEGILEILLNGEIDVQNYVKTQVSYDLFENEVYAELFDIIINEIEENGTVNLHHLIQLPEFNEDLTEIVTRLSVEGFQKDIRYARDCIYSLKKWQLERKARNVEQHLKAEGESEESTLHYLQELSHIRKEINQLKNELN